MLKNIKEFKLPQIEEKVLEFWKKNNIFQKSVANRKSGKIFNFYEGPPTANGHPGIHHVLARSFKDIILRYKTMAGFFVPRKGGWDTHGLPVEIGVEKQLGLKSKKDIEKFGIAEFNQKCRESVWQYKEEWERVTERMGYWLDMKHPYVTYETKYIESLWWIFGEAWKKKILYKGHKIVPWCTRCGTGLSSHELAQGYKEATDTSVYLKFRLKKGQQIAKGFRADQNTYILSWTTTAWTLPGNVALAVGEKIKYVVLEYKGEKAAERWIVAKDIYEKADSIFKPMAGPLMVKRNKKVVPLELFGKDLVGAAYEPLWPVKPLKNAKSHKIYAADFVTTTDGTGVVHTAVMYGEDDYQLGKKLGLPQHHTVDETGKFVKDVPKLAGMYAKSAETEKKIFDYLADSNLLVKTVPYTHEYPFCWRCSTPLLYYARDSWFMAMSKLRDKLLTLNKKINWIPETIKTGRFGEWIKEVKDWALSRERYWGTPLPIWTCEKGHVKVVGSIQDLSENIVSTNSFWAMRHGVAEHNVKAMIAAGTESNSHISKLTPEGVEQVKEAAKELKKKKIDLIFTSPYERTKATAKIIAKATGAKVIEDRRLAEINCGIFNWKTVKEYHNFYDDEMERFTKAPSGGETLNDVKRRMFAFIKDVDAKYQHKNILIVSHGDPIMMLDAFVKNLTDEQIAKMDSPDLADIREIKFKNVSYDAEGQVDLHRPYIDSVELTCADCGPGRSGKNMKRIKDLADVWFDSGAMPYASVHYPFENKEALDKHGAGYPADYIVEGIDQTRGWFYTLLAIAAILDRKEPYKNVIALGLLLDKFSQKMSKSKGNVIDPVEMINKYGVDVVRWYFYTVNPPGEPKNFDEDDLGKVSRRFFGTLYNSFVFYDTSLHKSEQIVRPNVRHVLDRWILSRLHETIKEAAESLDQYEIGAAGRIIEALIDDLSRWYIRRSRSREEATRVLGYVLFEVSKLIAPFAPFFADALYQGLGGTHEKQSVHIADWPKLDEGAINQDLNAAMKEVRRLAAAALALRAENALKVRQPLNALRLKDNKMNLTPDLLEVLKEEINVKNVVFEPKLTAEMELDTVITEELRREGIVRDLNRTMQNLRAKANLKPGQKIDVYFEGPKDITETLKAQELSMRNNVSARDILFKRTEKFDALEEMEIDGQPVWIAIKVL